MRLHIFRGNRAQSLAVFSPDYPWKGGCTVMIRGTLNGLAFVAGCALAAAVPAAQAQTLGLQTSMYDRLLDPYQAERHSRILKECEPIIIAHLRAGCLDSFGVYEDQRSVGWNEGLTGDSNGRMNSIDRTLQGPEKYDPRLGR